MSNQFSLDDIFDKFANPKIKIFTDRNVLRATYIPESLPHREKEMKQLASIVGPVIAGGTPSNAFLYGKTGLGKTVVTKAVLNSLKKKVEELGKRVNMAYINCQIIDTTYRVYAHLCNAIQVQVPITGLPTDEVISKFALNLDKLSTHLIVVLDEIDFLQKKDSKTLYGLTRINSELNNSTLSLIGVTNDVMFKQDVDARVRSTLTEQEIVFFPYNSTQLKQIITERAKLGFSNGILKESAINLAAALAGSEHGDARRALDLIRTAGEIVERDGVSEITEEHVREALKVIEIDAISEVLGSLPLQSKAVLLAIYEAETSKEQDEIIKTSQIYDKYVSICEHLPIDPLTQRRVGDLINELDVLGMIKTSIISKGRYGRSRIINLSVQPGEIKRILEKDVTIKYYFEG
jgi:archaeal cell division control protein 6